MAEKFVFKAIDSANIEKNIIWFLFSKIYSIHKKSYLNGKSQADLWRSEYLIVFHS